MSMHRVLTWMNLLYKLQIMKLIWIRRLMVGMSHTWEQSSWIWIIRKTSVIVWHGYLVMLVVVRLAITACLMMLTTMINKSIWTNIHMSWLKHLSANIIMKQWAWSLSQRTLLSIVQALQMIKISQLSWRISMSQLVRRTLISRSKHLISI